MKYIIACFLSFILVGCGSRTTVNNHDLVGKWKLISYLADIGDGKGIWQEAGDENKRIIEFKSNGGFSDPQNENAQAYRLFGKDTIQFLQSDNSQLYAVTILKLTADSLVLKPACIEACGERYARVE